MNPILKWILAGLDDLIVAAVRDHGPDAYAAIEKAVLDALAKARAKIGSHAEQG